MFFYNSELHQPPLFQTHLSQNRHFCSYLTLITLMQLVGKYIGCSHFSKIKTSVPVIFCSFCIFSVLFPIDGWILGDVLRDNIPDLPPLPEDAHQGQHDYQEAVELPWHWVLFSCCYGNCSPACKIFGDPERK